MENKKISMKKFKFQIFREIIFRKRFIVTIILFLTLLLSIMLWSIFIYKDWIVAGGSTSVDPIMEEITPWYKDHEGTDFVYNSMGSAAAPAGVRNGYYSIGFESKLVQPTNDYDTFAIAKDFFIFLFNLPKGITIDTKDLYASTAIKSENMSSTIPLPKNASSNPNKGDPTKGLGLVMKDIYKEKGETWLQLNNDIKSQLTLSKDIFKGNANLLNKKISTYTRESGSGTRDYMEKNIIGISGSTNSSTSVVTSNGGMMNAVQNTASSIGYLSFSYIDNISEQIHNGNGLTIGGICAPATSNLSPILPYNGLINDITNPTTKFEFNNAYKEVRPFIGLINPNLSSKKLANCLNFIHSILYNPKSSDTGSILGIDNIIKNLGFERIGYYDPTSSSSSAKDEFSKINSDDPVSGGGIYDLMGKYFNDPNFIHNPPVYRN